MKDWKGNEIQAGHTLVVIATKYMNEDSSMCMVRFNNEKVWDIVSEAKPEKKSYLFDVCAKYLITEPGGCLRIPLADGLMEVPFNLIDACISIQSWQIACIEGVSDSKEDYYMDYFSR